MDKAETVYDSDDLQLQEVEKALEKRKVKLTDFSTPEHVHFILQRERINLTKIKENKSEIKQLQDEVLNLKNEREELRIELAKRGEREKFSWIEIPLGMFCGYAINILTAFPKDVMWWVFLICAGSIIIFLRLNQFRVFTRKDSSDA